MKRRIGVLGGTFDPIHVAHLVMADRTREDLQLDEVLIVPAYLPPHKESHAITDAKRRHEMARLAVAGRPGLSASAIELQRGGVSYTVDTLRDLHRERPDTQWYLILGADSVAGLPDWREPAEILRLADVVPVRRPGSDLDFGRLSEICSAATLARMVEHTLEMPLLEVSSTELRSRVAAGKSIRFLVPPAVEAYIAAQGLYRHQPE